MGSRRGSSRRKIKRMIRHFHSTATLNIHFAFENLLERRPFIKDNFHGIVQVEPLVIKAEIDIVDEQNEKLVQYVRLVTVSDEFKVQRVVDPDQRCKRHDGIYGHHEYDADHRPLQIWTRIVQQMIQNQKHTQQQT